MGSSLERREATPDEDAALDAAAATTVAELGRRGLIAEVGLERLNRRKIDLIPEPGWADAPKALTSELLAAVQGRLRAAGLAGLGAAVELAVAAAEAAGLTDPRVTSDAKHIEIGLTDKADSARWAFAELARRGVGPGSCWSQATSSDRSADFEEATRPSSCPRRRVRPSSRSVPSRAARRRRCIRSAAAPPTSLACSPTSWTRRKRWDVPELDGDPGWTITIDGLDPQLERVHESLLTLADGRLGTRGAPIFDHFGCAWRRARGRLHGRRTVDRARPVPRLDTPPADPAHATQDHAAPRSGHRASP